jgi:hypothetical protein
MKMVSRVQDNYSNIFTTRDELVSTLYLAVLDLYNKGYYLHQTLIFKTFVNLLNEECRRRKGATIESFSTVVTKDEDGQEITILDQLADTMFDDDEEDEEYWHDMFEKVKSRMLEDMSELTFERILIQLMSKTVDRKTSYILDKYRQIFAPDYVPRPNRNSKTKGGNK